MATYTYDNANHLTGIGDTLGQTRVGGAGDDVRIMGVLGPSRNIDVFFR